MKRFLDFLSSHNLTQVIKNPNFLLMLAVFNVTVLMNYHDMIWRRPIIIGVVFIMAGFSFLNLRFWWAAMVTIIINFVLYLDKFPRLANHSNIELFVCLIFISTLIWKWRKPNFSIPPRLISNIFRVSLVTIYFYTGFHKLNSDFFNPCVSCVNQINEQFFENFTRVKTTLPAAVSVFFQYATIFVEMILPFGLFWRQTRTVTAILLLGFHAYLGFTVFSDFQAFAIFMIIGSTLDFEKKPDARIGSALRLYILTAMVVLFLKPFLFKFFKDSDFVNFIHGSIFNVGVIFFFVIYFRNNRAVESSLPKPYFTYPILVIFVISCWSMKAYFGFGNSANLTMFSNLMTESSRSNHLLIDTKKTKITDWEEDNVLILELHDTLKYTEKEGYKLPIIEFRYLANLYAKRYPKTAINCTFVYKNDTIFVPDLKKSEYVKTKWWYQYINFRKIQPEGPNKCLW